MAHAPRLSIFQLPMVKRAGLAEIMRPDRFRRFYGIVVTILSATVLS